MLTQRSFTKIFVVYFLQIVPVMKCSSALTIVFLAALNGLTLGFHTLPSKFVTKIVSKPQSNIPIHSSSHTSRVLQVSTVETDVETIQKVIQTPPINYDSQYELSPQQFIYVVLSSLFVTCLLIADVIGVKLFEIPLPFEILGHKTIEHTCGMLTFPITFLLGDVINEYYGAKAAKNTVYIGLAMSILVFIVMNVAQAMPYLDKPFNVSQESFDMIFGSAKLIYVASICAYVVGSLSDIWLFGIIKKLTQGKLLWLRATGSTILSQIIDSFIVSYIAFDLGKSVTGQVPATFEEVLNIAATGYGLKLFLSLSLTPVIYIVKGILTDKFGLQPLPAEPLDSEPIDTLS